MRHYTWSDMLYNEGVENAVLAANGEYAARHEFNHPSKKLLVRNEGPNDVFLGFDDDYATLNHFKLAAGDGLVELPVQCKKISAICNALETASVRITCCY